MKTDYYSSTKPGCLRSWVFFAPCSIFAPFLQSLQFTAAYSTCSLPQAPTNINSSSDIFLKCETWIILTFLSNISGHLGCFLHSFKNGRARVELNLRPALTNPNHKKSAIRFK